MNCVRVVFFLRGKILCGDVSVFSFLLKREKIWSELCACCVFLAGENLVR